MTRTGRETKRAANIFIKFIVVISPDFNGATRVAKMVLYGDIRLLLLDTLRSINKSESLSAIGFQHDMVDKHRISAWILFINEPRERERERDGAVL